MIRSFPFSEHPHVGTTIMELPNYLVFVAMVADYRSDYRSREQCWHWCL